MGTPLSRPCDQRTGNDTLDTVTMARKEREKNGPWEVELSYGGEADLYKHEKDCKKNPSHENFKPVEGFNVEDLPSGYQDIDIVNLIKAMSDLTVRVSVNYVSEERPETVPGIDMPYPQYRNRGSRIMRVGSGLVSDVNKLTNEGKNCDCKECLNSEKPRTNFGYIRIRTATHVVYDNSEAAHTTCHLFFDRGGIPDACVGVVKLSGFTDVVSYTKSDLCTMTCVTHDLDLIDKLEQMVACHSASRLKINHNERLMSRVPQRLLTIIVSHPHGCSKKVSVGYTRDPNSVRGVYTTWTLLYRGYFLYTTATCPGSSGAFVWTDSRGILWYLCGNPHIGHWPKDKKLNFCCGYSWP